MKLLLVTNYFPPVVDGVGDYTRQVAAEFSNRGHEVHIICKKDPRIPSSQDGMQIWPIATKWSFANIQEIIKKINELGPAWVMIQYVPYSFNRYGIPFAFPFLLSRINRNRTKILLTVHEPYIRFRRLPIKTFLVGQLQRIILRELCRKADKIVTTIDKYKGFVNKYSAKEVHIIPVPSNIIPVSVSEEELKLLRNRIAPAGQKIITTFGIRDHRFLIDVFKAVLLKQKNVFFLICGKTRDTALYDSIKDRTFITGYLESEELFKYLKCADVFFLPDGVRNGSEGGTSNKSTSLAAAFAAGLPIVGIKGDMNNVLLKEAENLYLEERNAGKIAERIDQLLNVNFNNQNYSFWQRFLSTPVIVDQYQKILAECSPSIL